MATEKEKSKMQGVKYSSWWGVFICVWLIFIDQLTKALADAYQWDFDVIEGWVSVHMVYNRGISYGIGSGAPTWVKIGVIILTGVMMATLSVLYFKIDKRRTMLRVALPFVVAGGLGNLIDRVYYKVWIVNGAYGVRDMVDLSRFGFAVCNFADFFITAGVIMLVLAFLFFDKDAFFPVGKYKKLQEEAKAAEVAGTEAKQASQAGATADGAPADKN